MYVPCFVSYSLLEHFRFLTSRISNASGSEDGADVTDLSFVYTTIHDDLTSVAAGPRRNWVT